MVRYVIASSVIVIALLALWMSCRAEEHRPAAAVAEPARTIAPPLSPPHSPPRPQLEPVVLPAAPQALASSPLRDTLDGFDAWLAATHASTRPALFDVDCSSPPCLIAVTFDASSASAQDIRALLAGVRAELERRLGVAISVTHADEDASGRAYLWMYSLPAELAIDQREALRASAEARYSLRMDPLRPRGGPALPE